MGVPYVYARGAIYARVPYTQALYGYIKTEMWLRNPNEIHLRCVGIKGVALGKHPL